MSRLIGGRRSAPTPVRLRWILTMISGANPDQLDALAGQFRSAATLLAAAEKQLSAKLVSSPWRGAKADRFRADWSRRYRRDLAAARQFLATGETALRRNAQEQRAASNSRGGATSASAGAVHFAAAIALGGVLARSYSAANQFKDAWETKGFVQTVYKGRRILQMDMTTQKLLLRRSQTVGQYFKGGKLDRGLKGLGLLNVVVHSFKASQAFGEGNVDRGIRESIDVAWAGVGTVFPVVGLMKLAWDSGWWAGTEIAKRQESAFHTSDNTVAYAYARYGSEAMAHRYDGVRGFGNSIVGTGSWIGSRMGRK